MTSVPAHHGVTSSPTPFVTLRRGNSAALQISAGQGGRAHDTWGGGLHFLNCVPITPCFYGRFWRVFLRLCHYILALLSVCLSPGESLVCPVLAFSVPIKSNNLLGTSFLEQWFSQKSCLWRKDAGRYHLLNHLFTLDVRTSIPGWGKSISNLLDLKPWPLRFVGLVYHLCRFPALTSGPLPHTRWPPFEWHHLSELAVLCELSSLSSILFFCVLNYFVI